VLHLILLVTFQGYQQEGQRRLWLLQLSSSMPQMMPQTLRPVRWGKSSVARDLGVRRVRGGLGEQQRVLEPKVVVVMMDREDLAMTAREVKVLLRKGVA